MPNEPLTQARVPDTSFTADLAAIITNSVSDLAPNTSPAFASVAARDLAYANWVARGNTMRNGLTCSVMGRPMMYRDSKWRGVLSTYLDFTGTPVVWNVLVQDNDPRIIATIPVFDVGYEVRVRSYATVEVQNTAPSRGDSRVRIGGDVFDLFIGTTDFHKHSDLSPKVYSGNFQVSLEAYRGNGATTGGYVTTGVNFTFRVELVPA